MRRPLDPPYPMLTQDLETGRIVVELSVRRFFAFVALVAAGCVATVELLLVTVIPWLADRWASVGWWPW